jgi:hypothetical protein
VRFVIGGVQKGGTTALAHYLAQHPRIRLPDRKEAHVFDAPDFDDTWSPADVDARYASHFDDAADGAAAGGERLHGDATPIYILHRRLVGRIARYNPAMRWIVLLRDPVERAISQYHMERDRGLERWPMLAAFALERFRLAGHLDDFSDGSPLRTHSYLLRGDYARQLDVLHAHFPAQQVLLLRSDLLRADPLVALARTYDFLGIEAPAEPPDVAPVFEGRYPPPGPIARMATGLLLGAALRRMRERYGIAF